MGIIRKRRAAQKPKPASQPPQPSPPIPPPVPAPVATKPVFTPPSRIPFPPQAGISVVVPTWGQDTVRLERMIYTLVNQTQPPLEIIIVDGGPDHRYNLVKLRSRLVRVIQAHIPILNLSYLFNVGIRHARGEYVMTTGNDRLFSREFIEVASRQMNPAAMLCATWGMTTEKADFSGDIFARWDELLSYVMEGSTDKINPGTFQITPRSWLEKVRGFDEEMPYHFIDSDITGRAKRDGLFWPGVSYLDAQVIHQWHPEPKLDKVKRVKLREFERKQGVVRNPNGWGELPPNSPPEISFILTWKQRDHAYLRCCLHTLSNQTVPPAEIIVVDQEFKGDGKTRALCEAYPLCKYVHAPHRVFNISWGFNVGIKHSVGGFIITCGGEFMFSANYVATVQKYVTSVPNIWLISENAPIPADKTMEMLRHPDPDTALWWGHPYTQYPRGLHHCGTQGAIRDWWFKVRGWNEDYPFACSDGELWERAAKDGLNQTLIGIDEAQIFHLSHGPSKFLRLDKKYFDTYKNTPIVANPEKWGEL